MPELVKRKLRHLIDEKADLVTDLDLTEGGNPRRYPIHDLKAGSGPPNGTNIKKWPSA